MYAKSHIWLFLVEVFSMPSLTVGVGINVKSEDRLAHVGIVGCQATTEEGAGSQYEMVCGKHGFVYLVGYDVFETIGDSAAQHGIVVHNHAAEIYKPLFQGLLHQYAWY